MAQPPDDELNLIRAAIEGRPRAFEAIVAAYDPRLRWLAELRVSGALSARVGADDLLQETWLTASQQIGTLQVESPAAFWTWLCRVLEQRLIDFHRRHLQAAARDARREARPPPAGQRTSGVGLSSVLADPGASPSGQLKAAEQRHAIRAALDQLPESFREVIVLRILEGISVEETAEIIGRSTGATSVLLHKAMKRLAGVVSDLSIFAPQTRG